MEIISNLKVLLSQESISIQDYHDACNLLIKMITSNKNIEELKELIILAEDIFVNINDAYERDLYVFNRKRIEGISSLYNLKTIRSDSKSIIVSNIENILLLEEIDNKLLYEALEEFNSLILLIGEDNYSPILNIMELFINANVLYETPSEEQSVIIIKNEMLKMKNIKLKEINNKKRSIGA